MAFCTNCGTALPEDSNVCPNCGYTFVATGAAPEGQQPPYQAPYPPQQDYQQQYQYQQYQQPYKPRPIIPPGYDEADIQKNRILSVCAYLGLVFLLIPLIAQPDSKYCRFHANQGLVLTLFELCCGIVCIIPILGWIVGGIGLIFAFVCEIIGIVNSLGGKVSALPLIGKIDILH